MPALVHLNQNIAAFDGVELGGHVAIGAEAHIPEVEVVRRAAEDDRILFARFLRAVDVGCHARAILHRHHHLAVDDRDVLKLFLDCLALFDEGFGLFGRQLRTRALGNCGNGDADKRGEGKQAHSGFVLQAKNGLQ